MIIRLNRQYNLIKKIPRFFVSHGLGRVMLVAAGYFITGKLGLLMAIPPGYATAVWPASGVALAGVLLGDWKVWPGILIGSFLINIQTTLDTSTVFSVIKSVLLAASISGGAVLQAFGGASLVRRFCGYPNSLSNEKEILRFLMLGGPVSCFLNATWGVGSLVAAGLVTWDNALFSWWTWWVGDSVGVLIFAPIILLWFSKAKKKKNTGKSLSLCRWVSPLCSL